jgi:arginase
MRRIVVLDAPTNLGLRPPTATSVPGCYKAPGALRDHRLLDRLDARDAGCLTPPRYDPGDWRPGDGVAHAGEIARYSVLLADRIEAILADGEFPLVLGGDCSVLLGAAVAVGRLNGRYGLVFVDGHSDFRHPGNASYVGAAAGEDLALVTGRGQPDLTGIEGRRPYFRDVDVAVLGIRPQDEYRIELQAAGIAYRAVPELRSDGAARSAQWARGVLQDCDGYWVHIDVDVLDPAVMPAVDAPDPGGIAYAELELLLAGLVSTPRCLGVEVTVFDPDYDPDGRHAAELVDLLVAALAPVWAADRAAGSSAPGRRVRVPAARSGSPFVDFAPAPRHPPGAPEPAETAGPAEGGPEPAGDAEVAEPAAAAAVAGPTAAEPAPVVPAQARRAAGASQDEARAEPDTTRSRGSTGTRSSAGSAASPGRRAPTVDHGPGQLRRRPAPDEAPTTG